MTTPRFRLRACLLAGLFAVAGAINTRASDQPFELPAFIPDDVFLCVGTQHNPEREFLDKYWGEVFDALKQSGAGDDLMKLIGTVLDADEMGQVTQLTEKAKLLAAGVNWKQLAGKEMAFAERLNMPTQFPSGGVTMGPPDMVWLFRGSGDGAAQNYAGLVAILQAIVDEINHASDGAANLSVQQATRLGSDTATVDLLASVPDAPTIAVTVGLHDQIVFITFGDRIHGEILALLDGSFSGGSIAKTKRFQAAFKRLPPAEDAMVFFDVKAMLKPILKLVEYGVGAVQQKGDVYLNTRTNEEANAIVGKAIFFYRKGDYPEALSLIKKAHEVAPEDSIIIYNLACFNALCDKPDEAMTWLDKAVDAGFHAPAKIAGDSDFNGLQDDPRFKAAVEKARRLARQDSVADIVLNSDEDGEASDLCKQAWKAYDQKDYQKGLELTRQAYKLAPDDARVLYYLACFHALSGNRDKALDFLQKAVDRGFYSPKHIAKDPDLESLRSDARYTKALATARKNAVRVAGKSDTATAGVLVGFVKRIGDAAGMFDYVASVESTEGYSLYTETVAVLVAGAREMPFYPVFGKRPQLTNFDRYLPEETVSFVVSGGFDVGELYTFIEDSIREGGDEGAELLEQWTEFQQEIGFNIRDDLLNWIDGDVVNVTFEDGGSVMMVKVNDEETARKKVAAAIKFLSTKLTEFMSQNPALAMLAVRTSPTLDDRLEGFQSLYFAISPQPVVWGVADGQLIFGSNADAVATCLETAAGKHPNIRHNTRVMSEAIVPDGPFTTVALTDQRKLGDEIAAVLGGVSMGAGMMGAFIPDPEVRPIVMQIAGIVTKLTPVAQKINFFKSTATCTTFDGNAWRTRKVTHYFSPEERDTH